jgi:HlyD family secretion protein
MFKSNKLLKFSLIAVVALILILLIGKKVGFIGKEKPVEVWVDKSARRTIFETITANGKIEPILEVKVSADVSGEIIDLFIKEGQSVKKGQLLLKIKPNIYISALDRAQAALNNAIANLDNLRARYNQSLVQLDKVKLNYERNKKLWEDKTISQSEWEAAETEYKVAVMDVDVAKENVKAAEYNVKSAEASLSEARENLSKTSIYAPMDGIITVLNVEKGERVVGTEMMAGTELLRVADLDQMRVLVTVNENDIVRVKLGDTAIVEVDAFMGNKFKGIVSDIAHSASTSGALADQVTSFDVKINLFPESYKSLVTASNPYPLRPGMTANVDVRTQVKFNTVSVPLEAITSRYNKADSTAGSSAPEVVFVVDNNRAILKKVKTGIQDDSFIEILDGLKEGETVVVGPFTAVSKRLSDKALVKIVKKNSIINEK